jgi:hypothetical protein
MVPASSHSHSREVSPSRTEARGYAGLTSERSARTPFKNDERNSPRGRRLMPDFARPGAGIDEPVTAGAAHSASVTPRNGDRGGRRREPWGLTPRRLHQIASEPRRDGVPAIRAAVPTPGAIGVFPSVLPIPARQRCGGDQRLDRRGHHQPLSAGNIFAVAARVSWKRQGEIQ